MRKRAWQRVPAPLSIAANEASSKVDSSRLFQPRALAIHIYSSSNPAPGESRSARPIRSIAANSEQTQRPIRSTLTTQMMTKTMDKRTYTRRTDEDRIRDLEAKLAQVKAKLEAKETKNSPLQRAFARAQRVLRKFEEVATESGRTDVALSIQAFTAGIERSVNTNPEESTRRKSRGSNFGSES
jgi:hypothetical protein